MLIDVSYFMSGPRHIENVSVAEMPSPQSLAVNEVINGYIKAFQPEFLRNVVGVTLSQAITDYWSLLNGKRKILQMKLIFQKRRKPPSPDMQYYARSCVNRSLTMSFIIFFVTQTPRLQ